MKPGAKLASTAHRRAAGRPRTMSTCWCAPAVASAPRRSFASSTPPPDSV
jgi:hypothetical protein